MLRLVRVKSTRSCAERQVDEMLQTVNHTPDHAKGHVEATRFLSGNDRDLRAGSGIGRIIMGRGQRSAAGKREGFAILRPDRPAATKADRAAVIFIDYLHQRPDFGALILVAIFNSSIQRGHISIALLA